MQRNSRTLTALAAVAGVAALGAVAPSAQASYFLGTQATGVCKGISNLHGIGASGVRAAQLAWGNQALSPSPAAAGAFGFGYDAGADYPACAAFKTAADAGTNVLDYAATGSGSCVTGIIGTTGPRQYVDAVLGTINDVAYCGTEDAPTEAQLTAAEGGPAATVPHPAEANFVTIPVAQVAAAVNLRLPDGCQVADNSKRSLTRDQTEGAFEGTVTTWGGLFGTNITASGASPTSAECQAKAFKRVVRLDNSGTTFLLKRYLQGVTDLPGGSIVDWREPSFGGSLANNAWPNDAGATAVVRGDANGNGSALDKLSLQSVDGGIGYADLATSRAKDYGWTYSGSYLANDTKIWARIQRVANDSFVSPGVTNAETSSGDNLGAACTGVSYSNQPTTDLGASWAQTTSVPTATDYGICGLNYLVASVWGFDTGGGRNKPVWAGATNAGEFRAARDYLRYVIGVIRPGVGPSKLPPAGYAKLPSDVRATAICEVNLVGYLRASSDPAPGSAIPRGTCP